MAVTAVLAVAETLADAFDGEECRRGLRCRSRAGERLAHGLRSLPGAAESSRVSALAIDGV